MTKTLIDYLPPKAEICPLSLLEALLADSFGSDGIEGFDNSDQVW